MIFQEKDESSSQTDSRINSNSDKLITFQKGIFLSLIIIVLILSLFFLDANKTRIKIIEFVDWIQSLG